MRKVDERNRDACFTHDTTGNAPSTLPRPALHSKWLLRRDTGQRRAPLSIDRRAHFMRLVASEFELAR